MRQQVQEEEGDRGGDGQMMNGAGILRRGAGHVAESTSQTGQHGDHSSVVQEAGYIPMMKYACLTKRCED